MFLFLAEIANQAENVGGAKEINFMHEFLQMIFTLIIVLALAIFTLMMLKKLMRSRANVINENSAIRVLEKRNLSSKASLYLVDILGKGVVISETSQGIDLITELPLGADLEKMVEEVRTEKKNKTGFFSSFQKKLKETITKTKQ